MTTSLTELSAADRHRIIAGGFAEEVAAVQDWDAPTPVSYTHLTLPTKRIV